MVKTQVLQSFIPHRAKKKKQFLWSNFKGCSAGERIVRREDRRDDIVAACEQAATLHSRLAAGMDKHFLQNFPAHTDGFCHAGSLP